MSISKPPKLLWGCSSFCFLLLLYHGSMLRPTNMRVIDCLAVYDHVADGAYHHLVWLRSSFKNSPLLYLQILWSFLPLRFLATPSFSLVCNWSCCVLSRFCCRLGFLRPWSDCLLQLLQILLVLLSLFVTVEDLLAVAVNLTNTAVCRLYYLGCLRGRCTVFLVWFGPRMMRQNVKWGRSQSIGRSWWDL